jgi:hypothetical protein
MYLPPLIFPDLSLLFAVIALTLLVVLELSAPSLGNINLLIDRKKLKFVTLAFGFLFLITFAILTFNTFIDLL